jgi:hypothetical protein
MIAEKKINYIDNIKSRLMTKKYTYQFVPKRLRNVIKNQIKIPYKGKNLKPTYLVDLTHQMVIKYFSYGLKEYNLSSVVMRDRYGTWYNYYVDFLIENKIIELKSNYYAGKKSKTYILCKGVISKGEMERYKNFDQFLLKKYKNGILKNEQLMANYSYIEPDVRSKLISDLYSVDIKESEAEKYLNQLSGDSLNKNKYSVEAIKNKHFFYHFDNFGRFHTNFTILKGMIRENCLLIDGEETAHVDINNSQPLFLTAIIDQYDLNTAGIEPTEYALFKDKTIHGGLYKYFMDEFNIKDRKAVKELIYKVLFGKNLSDGANKKFHKLFPTIHNFIILYKESTDDYKSLAYELQRSESNLIFNNIIKEIMEKLPDVSLFTVHDSIVFPEIYKEQIEKIFYDKLKEQFNV